MSNTRVIKKSEIERIVNNGKKIYQKVKDQYEPKENGKYLAIEADSGEVFFGKTSIIATKKAMKKYPKKVFYLSKIGYDTLETQARGILDQLKRHG